MAVLHQSEFLAPFTNSICSFCASVSTGGDAVKIVEMTTKDLECCITLLVKQQDCLRGLTPVLKEVFLWVKCYQTALRAIEKSSVKGRVSVAHFTTVFF